MQDQDTAVFQALIGNREVGELERTSNHQIGHRARNKLWRPVVKHHIDRFTTPHFEVARSGCTTIARTHNRNPAKFFAARRIAHRRAASEQSGNTGKSQGLGESTATLSGLLRAQIIMKV
ncbi:MAG: hypothetical protein EBX70_03960 [Betaproteobacteria bacterium]|nr:hypothetical protein [Betaproteobacteria bacterium]